MTIERNRLQKVAQGRAQGARSNYKGVPNVNAWTGHACHVGSSNKTSHVYLSSRLRAGFEVGISNDANVETYHTVLGENKPFIGAAINAYGLQERETYSNAALMSESPTLVCKTPWGKHGVILQLPRNIQERVQK